MAILDIVITGVEVCGEESRGNTAINDINTIDFNCSEMSRGGVAITNIVQMAAQCSEMNRGNIGTLIDINPVLPKGHELSTAFLTFPAITDVRNGIMYGIDGLQYTGTLIVAGTASYYATLTKTTGADAYGGSGTCAKFTPTSTTNYGYWHLYIPVVASATFVLTFQYKTTSGWNGLLKTTIYDTDQTTPLLSSASVTIINDTNYHQWQCARLTPSSTGLCLLQFEIIDGSVSGYMYIDNVGLM